MVAYDADDVVLVVDGVVRGRKRPPPLTPGAWLETWTPRGVYTSARTFRGIHVAWYGAHVARLRRMLASLAEAEPELFEGVPVPATDEATAAIVEETLKEALQECAMQGIKGPGDALGASVGGELAIVLAVSPRPGEGAYRVGAHLTPLHVDADEPPIACVVDGPERLRLPAVKSTAWPTERAWMDRARPEDADETILAGDRGETLVEGCVSNLFVVVTRKDEATGKVAKVVQTAPEGRCLPGIARRAVLDACEREGVATEEIAPLAADRGRWREAFVTNAIKLVRPVGEVRWPRGLGVDMGEGAEDVGLGGELVATIKDAESRPVTRRILERVVESLGRDIGPET